MPRLRGSFNTGSNLIQMYVDDVMRRGRAEYESQLMGQRQREDDIRQFALNKLYTDIGSGATSPDAIGPDVRSRLEPYYDLNKLTPSLERRVGTALSPILQKGDVKDIPDAGGIMQLLAAAGITPEQAEDPSVVTGLNSIAARKEELSKFIPATAVPSYDPTTGANRTDYVPQNELGGRSVQTSPTPEQKGRDFLTEQQAGPLSGGMAVAKAHFDNAYSQLTQDEAVRRAGAIEGAQARARYGAEFDPKIVTQRVDQAKRIAEATAQGKAAGEGGAGQIGALSAGERQALINITPMQNSHAKALDFENEGVRLNPTVIAATQPTLVGKAAANFAQLSPGGAKQLQYANLGVAWTNAYGQMRSGVQVREDEYPRYLAEMFALDSDSNELVSQKQNSRAAFASAVQLAMGRGAATGGVALAKGIINGTLSPNIARTLQFSSPEFEDAFITTLSDFFWVIRDDASGKIEELRKK